MKPSEVLDGAANIILRDGWHQGSYYKEVPWREGVDLQAAKAEDEEANKSAPCCQEGAICRAVCGFAWVPDDVDITREQSIARARANGYMTDYVKRRAYGYAAAIAWNDASSTTKEMVVAALRGAAEDARAAGE